MRNICIFIQWVTRGKICFSACREGLCHKKDELKEDIE